MKTIISLCAAMYYKKPARKPTKKSRNATLKAKLDRVFSEYIRLRDTEGRTKDGFFKCISCGQIKPYSQADCGHYIGRQHMATRYNEINCNAQCRYCLTPDALILMADFRWKKLDDIIIGDVLIAFDEDNKYKTARRYKTTRVLSCDRAYRDVYEVELANGDKIKTTKEHKWLARSGKTSGYQWIETQRLWINSKNLLGHRISGNKKEDVSSTICKPFLVVNQDNSHESGWISGMIDADGHITQQVVRDKRLPKDVVHYGLRIGISQSSGEIARKANSLLRKMSHNRSTCRQEITNKIYTKDGKCYNGKGDTATYLITGTNVEKIQFLQKVRPLKLSRVDINKLGKMRSQYDTTVKSIHYVGRMEVVMLETDAHTFFANGYAMHNCNRFNEGMKGGYRQGLVKKYGEDKVLLLEASQRNTAKISDFEYEEMIKYYKEKIKAL